MDPAIPTPSTELPDVNELTDGQQRGVECVRCKTRLDNGSAVDLGARRVDAHGIVVNWFPRCCAGCAS
ncbi:hypothetical protein [Streptomyces niveus]|uniref:hypothetical protein n=1 Tax=Streptomyces niveus TaxID=193462 RepID=UPI0033B493FA